MIPSRALSLEAHYEEGSLSETTVFCHPHPLYGGNMDNNVLVTLSDTFKSVGWGTLRFNFRGVGQSGREETWKKL
jgi:alpha/beta superfamily hydrolase